MVLSSQRSHWKHSLGWTDECRTTPSCRQLWNQADCLGLWVRFYTASVYANRHRRRLVLLSLKVYIHSTAPQGRRTVVNLGNAVRVCSLGTKLYRASRKSSTAQNFLQYFHSDLAYFREILLICCQFTSTHTYQFWSMYLNIWQNGVNFSRSSYRFYHLKFRVSGSQTALTTLLLMSGLNSPNLNPLDFQAWGNAGVFSQTATEAKNSFQV